MLVFLGWIFLIFVIVFRKKMFFFGVYFRKIMGKIVYTSTLPDCLNSHV